MEGAVVAEGVQEQLQRLGFDQPGLGRVVDHQMREIRLARDRTEAGEFRRGEAGEIEAVRMRVRHALEHGFLGTGEAADRMAELGGAVVHGGEG